MLALCTCKYSSRNIAKHWPSIIWACIYTACTHSRADADFQSLSTQRGKIHTCTHARTHARRVSITLTLTLTLTPPPTTTTRRTTCAVCTNQISYKLGVAVSRKAALGDATQLLFFSISGNLACIFVAGDTQHQIIICYDTHTQFLVGI